MRKPTVLRSLFLAVGLTLIVPAAPHAHAGPRWNATKRAFATKSPGLAKLLGVKNEMKVFTVDPDQMTLTVPNQPVWAAFGKNDAKGDARTFSVALGKTLARRGFMLATGGGQGLPKDTEDGAYAVGGFTLAFTPKGSLKSHSESHEGNIGQTTHLIPTGTGGGAGTISREAPMAQAANHGVASYANGGPGTFGELTAMLHNDDGVLVFLKGTGGVADAAPGWLQWLDAKPSFHAISGSDEHQLVQQAKKALPEQGLRFSKTRQLKLVSPGKQKDVLTEAETKNRSVAAFLTADPRVNVRDEERTDELRRLWAERSKELTGKPATLVVPSTILDVTRHLQMETLASNHDVRTVLIGPDKAERVKDMKGVRSIGLGLGDAEMGHFAAAREVTQHAEVVFFSSARYSNLSGLAYALRAKNEPIIAVLENKSTHGDKIAQMIDVIDTDRNAADRVVVASTPQALVEKVAFTMKARKAAAEKAAKEAKDAKKFDDKKGLD